MDAAFLPRAQAEDTLAWLQPHMASADPAGSIINGIEHEGTPVYRTDRKWVNQLVWLLCQPKTGFIALNRWRSRLAGLVLRLATGQGISPRAVGFFWYPVLHVSAAMLSYDVHHWRMARTGQYNEAFAWQASLHDVNATLHQVQTMDEQELAALQRAVNQELDALTALRATLKHQQQP
jgi:hypothetical protein